MKKQFCLMAIIMPFFILSACGGDDENQEPEIKEAPIEGVWQKDNYFISFNSSGYYCAYLGDDFLDSGEYTRDKNEITAENPYFSRETKYAIKQLTDNSISLDVDYVDVYGEKGHKSFVFQKSDIEPAKEGLLVGKSYSWLGTTFGYITMSFRTNNSGVKSAQRGSAADYPLNFYYFYIAERLYYQILPNRSIQVPTIGAWTGGDAYYTARCVPVKIESDGSLWSGIAIDI